MFCERLEMAQEEQKRLISGNEMLRRLLPKEHSKMAEVIEFPPKISSAA